MKRFSVLFFIVFSFSFLFSQTQPEFEYSGKLRATNYLTIPSAIYPATGDINGDSIPDLILGTYYMQVYQHNFNFSLVFLYDRPKDLFTFYDTLRNDQGAVLHGVKPIATDINFDDTLDLIINPNHNSNNYQIFKRITTNHFKLIDTIRDANNNYEPIDRVYNFVDANHDKKQDLYAVDFNNSLVYYENDSIYHFKSGYNLQDTSGTNIIISPDITYIDFFKSVDYSGVTIDTMLYVSTQDSFIYAYTMVTPTQFIPQGKVYDKDSNIIKVKNPRAVIDKFYADTLYDMLVFRDYRAPVKYRETRKGWKNVGYVIAENYFLQSFNYPDIFFYDVNKDGYQDAYMTDLYGHILVSLRDGKNNYFLLPDTLKTHGKPIEIGTTINFAIYDLDSDGKDDLFICDYHGNFLYYKQTTGNNFEFVDTLDKQGPKLSFAVGDFNVDSIKDLATCYENNGTVILFNLSQGKLDTAQSISLWANNPSIAGGDINGDGYDDFVILYDVNYSKDNITFFLNDGQGNFRQTDNSGYGQYHVGHDNYSIAMTDLNNDGKDDIVISQFSGSVNYWLNKTNTSSAALTSNNIELNIYPNPVVNILNLGIVNYQPINYEITDLQGRIVKKGVITGTSHINVSNLVSGVYLIKLETKQKVFSSKFIKL